MIVTDRTVMTLMLNAMLDLHRAALPFTGVPPVADDTFPARLKEALDKANRVAKLAQKKLSDCGIV